MGFEASELPDGKKGVCLFRVFVQGAATWVDSASDEDLRSRAGVVGDVRHCVPRLP